MTVFLPIFPQGPNLGAEEQFPLVSEMKCPKNNVSAPSPVRLPVGAMPWVGEAAPEQGTRGELRHLWSVWVSLHPFLLGT